MHKEKFDRIICVTQNRRFAVKRAAVDLAAGVVRNKAAAFKTAFQRSAACCNRESGQIGRICAAIVDDAAVLAGLADADGGFAASQVCSQRNGNKIVRNAVNRETGLACGLVVTVQDRFVIAGNGAGRITAVIDAPCGEIAFKEVLGLEMVRRRLHGLDTNILPALAVFEFFTA